MNHEKETRANKKKRLKSGKKVRIIPKKHSEETIILENKKRFEEIKKEENHPDNLTDEELEEDENFEFGGGFNLMPIAARSRNIEDIPIGTSLESGLTFAPRAGERHSRDKTKEAKNYAEAKYEVNYAGGKYGEKTPNLYSESTTSTSKEESKRNGNDNGNQGKQ